MRTILAILTFVALVLAPFQVVFESAQAAPTFPYATAVDVGKDAVSARPGICGGEPRMIVIELPEQKMMVFVADNSRIVAAEFPTAELDSLPTVIWIGHVESNGKIVMTDRHSFSMERDGPSPCGLLFPPNA